MSITHGMIEDSRFEIGTDFHKEGAKGETTLQVAPKLRQAGRAGRRSFRFPFPTSHMQTGCKNRPGSPHSPIALSRLQLLIQGCYSCSRAGNETNAVGMYYAELVSVLI